MTKHDYKQNAYYLIYLIRCILNDKIPAKEKLDKMDLSSLFDVAQSHSLTAIAAYALESAGVIDERFDKAKAMAIRKSIFYDMEQEAIYAELEKAGIWYMPTKGIILKEYYPMIGMREMSDIDILFDSTRAEDAKAIMARHGYDMQHDDIGHELAFIKEPMYVIELHTRLFGIGHDSELVKYYSDVKKRLIKDSDNGYGYHFSHEDFYSYMTAHDHKHFNSGGTGIRALMDIYVYTRYFDNMLDWDHISDELSKMGISEYEKKCRTLALKIFRGDPPTEDEKALLDYFIFSGTYGTTENKVKNQVSKDGGGFLSRIRYIKNRLFVPYNDSEQMYKKYMYYYPFFYKHRILFPLLPVYRLICALFKNRKKVFNELKALILQK